MGPEFESRTPATHFWRSSRIRYKPWSPRGACGNTGTHAGAAGPLGSFACLHSCQSLPCYRFCPPKSCASHPPASVAFPVTKCRKV